MYVCMYVCMCVSLWGNFVSFLCHFGVTCVYIWCHFGGHFGGHFGVTLGSHGLIFGTIWDHFTFRVCLVVCVLCVVVYSCCVGFHVSSYVFTGFPMI
jgi:hypothetical protein